MATESQIQRVKGLTKSPDPLLTMSEVRAVHAVCDELEQLRGRVEAAEEVAERVVDWQKFAGLASPEEQEESLRLMLSAATRVRDIAAGSA